MNINKKTQEILCLMYPPENIYLKGIEVFSPKRFVGTFNVLAIHSTYTRQPLAYVSTEQYIRCVSQGTYVFLGLLAEDGQAPIDQATFRQLMTNCQMWYRNVCLKFKRQTLKGENFVLTLHLKKVREIGSFFSCVLRVEGPVVGTIEFVAPKI